MHIDGRAPAATATDLNRWDDGFGTHKIQRSKRFKGFLEPLEPLEPLYAPKELPQPQVDFAFGLSILKPVSFSVSTKSSVVPTR